MTTTDAPPICVNCGLAEDEHHVFRAIELPDGCKCDADTWSAHLVDRASVPDICAGFLFDGQTGNCGNCEHDLQCHAKETVTT